MRAKLVLFALVLASGASHAFAQTAEKVDPQTGNYVPARDPFMKDDPDPDKANPNRLGNRQSKRNSPTTAPQPTNSTRTTDDGLTPAQRFAKGGAFNGQVAPSIQAPDGSQEQVDSNGFVSMGGMAMYTPPGPASASDDAFAKPDWWPQ